MIKQYAIIFMVTYLGEMISKSINFPFPGPVIGMLILFILLERKLIDVDFVEKGANNILLNLAIFFIPPGVGLISALDLLNGNVLKIVVTMILTTIITMVTTGLTVQYLINRRKK
ncbi:CidA/LrgA family protein [Psychrilyobacter atlanticus]|uniref:CidA/LrgA family protein n=1 Tax=Psychrilyobacter atlanticus TaxID=271091 RepID=UPI00041D9588|nr:CidA/LrgA family protein [Psychrilyobacter atlanticus]